MQEDKDILLKYLCMALPYGIIVDYGYNAFDVHNGNYVKHGSKCILKCYLLDVFISPRQNEKGEYIKPYLRPMSSMTKEERKEYKVLTDCSDYTYFNTSYKVIEWLLKNHFDFMGLIPKGLAIEINGKNNPY